jgi:hypothetical protein
MDLDDRPPPVWAIGEDLAEPEPVESYLVYLRWGLVFKVTQKRGFKLMLTVNLPHLFRTRIPPGQDWHSLSHAGTRLWADRVQQPEYGLTPPEIQINETWHPPLFLLCDDIPSDPGLVHTLVMHTAVPIFVAEMHSGPAPADALLSNGKDRWLEWHSGTFETPDDAPSPHLRLQLKRLLKW